MKPATDWDLLGRYVRLADHDAFAELVRRHIGFVYAIARRQTRDATLAEDVTQAVMIVLARKAGTISDGSVLTSWLFTVTRHASRNAMKLQARHLFHERHAARERREIVENSTDTNPLQDVLNEAIARLPERDRRGVLLHYYHGRAHEDVAATLGLSLHASRRRVSRAVEKMRSFFADRGVAVSAVGTLIAVIHTEANATAVPAEFVSSTINIAMLSSGAGVGSTTTAMTIAKGVTQMFTIAKLKVAAIFALVATGIAGAAAIPLAGFASKAFTTTTTTALVANAPSTSPATADLKFTTEVTKDVSVEFLGVSPYPADENSWFTIAGQPIELPDHRLLEGEVKANEQPEHQIAIRVDKPRDAVVLIYIDDSMMASNANMQHDDEFLLLSRFTLQGPSPTASIRLGFSTSDWKTVAVSENAQEPANTDAGEYGTIAFSPPEPDAQIGGTKVDVHHHTLELPYRVIAIDNDGKEHVSNNVNVTNTNDDAHSSYTFDLDQDKMKKLQFQVREIDKWLEVRDISLSADHKTQPELAVTEGKRKR